MRIKCLALCLALALPAVTSAAPISLYAGNNVSLGQHVNVAGNVGAGHNAQMDGYTAIAGNVQTGNSASLNQHVSVAGNVVAGQQVSMDGYATISGNVDASQANGVAVNMGQNAQVTGTVKHYGDAKINKANGATVGADVAGTPSAVANFALPNASTFAGGGANIKTNGNATTILAAGNYGKLDLGSHNTLKLSAGNYYFDSLLTDGYNSIIFDLTGGAISLFFTGNVNIGSNLDIQTIGGGADKIYAETHGNWTQDGYGEWFGTIFASANGGDLSFGSHSDLVGNYYAAQNITIDGYSNITGANGATPPASIDVPEPASLLLLGVGLLGLALIHRRAQGG